MSEEGKRIFQAGRRFGKTERTFRALAAKFGIHLPSIQEIMQEDADNEEAEGQAIIEELIKEPIYESEVKWPMGDFKDDFQAELQRRFEEEYGDALIPILPIVTPDQLEPGYQQREAQKKMDRAHELLKLANGNTIQFRTPRGKQEISLPVVTTPLLQMMIESVEREPLMKQWAEKIARNRIHGLEFSEVSNDELVGGEGDTPLLSPPTSLQKIVSYDPAHPGYPPAIFFATMGLTPPPTSKEIMPGVYTHTFTPTTPPLSDDEMITLFKGPTSPGMSGWTFFQGGTYRAAYPATWKGTYPTRATRKQWKLRGGPSPYRKHPYKTRPTERGIPHHYRRVRARNTPPEKKPQWRNAPLLTGIYQDEYRQVVVDDMQYLLTPPTSLYPVQLEFRSTPLDGGWFKKHFKREVSFKMNVDEMNPAVDWFKKEYLPDEI